MFKDILNKVCYQLFPGVELHTIELIEKQIGKTFPKELKDFYSITNGCHTTMFIRSQYEIPLGGIEPIEQLENLIQTVKEFCNEVNSTVIIEDIDNLIPISPTATQAVLFIGCGGDKLNRVYLADTGLIEPIDDNLFLLPCIEVASSLIDFFENSLFS